MRIVFAVLFLLIAYVASYPTYHDSETNNDENNFELELRSILNQLDEEQMTRSLTTDEENDDDDDDEYAFSKRQGGLNTIDKQSDCEIKCIYNERNPPRGKGKTIKEAAKVCKSKCPSQKKRGEKKIKEQKKEQLHKKLNLREFVDDDDSSNDSEEQQTQRRQFYDYLMQQLQQNNDE